MIAAATRTLSTSSANSTFLNKCCGDPSTLNVILKCDEILNECCSDPTTLSVILECNKFLIKCSSDSNTRNVILECDEFPGQWCCNPNNLNVALECHDRIHYRKKPGQNVNPKADLSARKAALLQA